MVALAAVACGGAGGGSVSRQPGTGEAGNGAGSGAVDAGLPPSGPGPDGGQVPDSGTGGSGAGDAGSSDAGTGGPVAGDAGSSDAGTGGPGAGDAGSPDAGGPFACGTPAPADVCHQLNPPLGAPVVHQEMEILSSTGNGISCGAGAYPSSGTGVVLHRMEPDFLPPRLDYVDRTGAQIASDGDFSIATFEITAISQPTGFGIFAPYIGGIGYYPLALVDDHAVGRAGANGYRVFELPNGGVGLFSFRENATGCGQQTRVFVQRFEDSGARTPADPTDLGCFPQTPYAVMAGNGAGNVLVLTDRISGNYTGWDGIWLDAELRVVSRFRTPELDAAVNNKDAAVAALLDGSFVIRFDQKWQLRIQPGATTTEPAPCWLAARPGTDVQVTRDRKAYVLDRHGATSCGATLELFTPQGES
ncbi:MAG TPA: hypothetical protein VFN91_04170, partial [Myxococcaceae bacterium]|nr:hypothetical protein [Myxococcaceae bacterium]